jgi:hypothetical protein
MAEVGDFWAGDGMFDGRLRRARMTYRGCRGWSKQTCQATPGLGILFGASAGPSVCGIGGEGEASGAAMVRGFREGR